MKDPHRKDIIWWIFIVAIFIAIAIYHEIQSA